MPPDGAAELVTGIRARRPDPTFTVSLRVSWDSRTDDAQIQANQEQYEAAGVQHLLYAPERGDIDVWLAGMEQLAGQLHLA